MALHTFANNGVTMGIPSAWSALSEDDSSASFKTTGGANLTVAATRAAQVDTRVLTVLEQPGFMRSVAYEGVSPADPTVKIVVYLIYSPAHGKMMVLETASNVDYSGTGPAGTPKVMVYYSRELPDPQGTLTEADLDAQGVQFVQSRAGQESLAVLNTVKTAR